MNILLTPALDVLVAILRPIATAAERANQKVEKELNLDPNAPGGVNDFIEKAQKEEDRRAKEFADWKQRRPFGT